MTDTPTDPVDSYERTLTRAVRSFSDQAVVPIDATAVARAAIGAAHPPTLAGRIRGAWDRVGVLGRLGTIAATGLLVVAGAAVLAGSPQAQVIVPVATETPVASAGAVMCSPTDVHVRITGWEGAPGHRIATVKLTNTSTVECSVESLPQPWLADGSGRPLIVGHATAGPLVRVAPGEVLHTLVQVGNFCGTVQDTPVTLAFTQTNGSVFVATALAPDDVSGVPPCNGEQGPKDDIEMQPWSN